MTKSQVTAALSAPCVAQTGPGSKLPLPETVCLGCPVLSPHCSYCTGYFQGRISTGKTEYIFMENIQFKPEYTEPFVMTPLCLCLCPLSGPGMTWVNVGPSSQPQPWLVTHL